MTKQKNPSSLLPRRGKPVFAFALLWHAGRVMEEKRSRHCPVYPGNPSLESMDYPNKSGNDQKTPSSLLPCRDKPVLALAMPWQSLLFAMPWQAGRV
jgi:hypothetical protein